MKKIFSLLLLSFGIHAAMAQNFHKPNPNNLLQAPEWIKELYSEHPNIYRLETLYRSFFESHPFAKSYHTQYYKRFMRKYKTDIDENGNVLFSPAPSPIASFATNKTASSNSMWNLIGPFSMKNANNEDLGQQANIYSIYQSGSNPNMLFCGTEPGDIFRSIDGGLSWACVSFPLSIGSVGAISGDPTNENIVYAATQDYLLKSTDGGTSWTVVLNSNGFYGNEILVSSTHPDTVLVASDNGLFLSNNGGSTWTNLSTEKCFDLKEKPGNSQVIYGLRYNTTLGNTVFIKSTDGGQTFTEGGTNWFISNNNSSDDMGGRLAVSPASPERVYAYRIGDSKANDFGYIGLFRSDDAGDSWTLPNGPTGGPYTSTHLNLAYGEPSWTYHQGYYNCALMANPSNADEILVGGLNVYRSTDAGATFTAVAGYVGGDLDMHVDMQDFRVFGNTSWISTDGGIYRSSNFFSTQPEVRNYGIHATEFWGFDCGWNEDVMIGGAYHNGVPAYHENYGTGTFLNLGGAEPASGYVNKGENRKVSSSEVGGKILPLQIGQNIGGFGVSLFPNESYWGGESSEMETDPDCYNRVWIGNKNKLWRCEGDNPYAFNQIYAFGTNENEFVQHIEICRGNKNIMYLSQRAASGNNGKLWKSTDGGSTWNTLSIPSGNSSRILIQVDAENPSIVFIAYPYGQNGQKTFKSTDGGATWTNLSSTELNNDNIYSITAIPASNGGIYAFGNKNAYYRDNNSSTWQVVNQGLPALLKSNISKPFYKNGKIRIGTYGKGIWENDLITPPSHPIAQISVDKLEAVILCEADTFHFSDYSILSHQGSTRSWSFPGGQPNSSNQLHPSVSYGQPGTYMAYLTITDSLGNTDSDTLQISVSNSPVVTTPNHHFESSFPGYAWFLDGESDAGQWGLSASTGGFGNSPQCAVFDNYNFDAQGQKARLFVQLQLMGTNSDYLYFDRAYAPYGGIYSDSLSIEYSTDCGQQWTRIYLKGGDDLATAPQDQNATFVPTASQWVTDSVSLSAVPIGDTLFLAFTNHGRYGQAQYIDNIRTEEFWNIKETEGTRINFSLAPNPGISQNGLKIMGNSKDLLQVSIYDAHGKRVYAGKHHAQEMISCPDLSAGMYLVRVQGETNIQFLKWQVLSERK